MDVLVVTVVQAPEGATHYIGDLLEDPVWFKCIEVGGYDHWFQYSERRSEWMLCSHSKPHWAKPILEENRV